MRIAVLEDDADQLELLKLWLADAGYDVHAYLTCKEAIRGASHKHFDLFLLDWNVSQMRRKPDLKSNGFRLVPISSRGDRFEQIAGQPDA